MTALVSWRPGDGALIPPVGGRAWTYDLTTPSGRKGMYLANAAPAVRLKTLIGQTIEVEHVVIRWVDDDGDHPDETGLRLRAILVGPDGRRVSTSSPHALKGFEEAATIACAAPPFTPPLRFTVRKETNPANGRDWLWLEWEG